MFKDDLKMIKLAKSDLSMPSNSLILHDKLLKGFGFIASKYSLSSLLDNGNYLTVDEIVSRIVNSSEPYKTLDILRYEISKELKKKEFFYQKVMAVHEKRLKINPELAVIKISFSLTRSYPQQSHVFCERLQNHMRDFFNKMRGRVLLNRIRGYFWVMLRDVKRGLPYYHVCFYVDNKYFNAKLGAEIEDLWMKCTIHQGELKHFTFNEYYGNYGMASSNDRGEGYRFFVKSKDIPNIRKMLFEKDFSENFVSDPMKISINVEIKEFERYVFALSLEMFSFVEGMRDFYTRLGKCSENFKSPRLDSKKYVSNDKKGGVKGMIVRAYGLSIL